MAYRLTKEKAAGIAAEYCVNGFVKTAALLSVGYSTTYANNVGLKLFEHDKVLRAIAKIQAVAIVNTSYSIEQALTEYEQVRILAVQLKQPAAAVSAITGKARLYGMDKDANITNDAPKQLTKDNIKDLLELSKALTAKQLSKKESDDNRKQIRSA